MKLAEVVERLHCLCHCFSEVQMKCIKCQLRPFVERERQLGALRDEMDDIAEDMADKLGIYGEERSYWVSEFKQRVRAAMEVERKLQAVERTQD